MTIEDVYTLVVELKKQLYEEKEAAAKAQLQRTYAFASHFVVGACAFAIGLGIGSCHFVTK